MSRGTIQILNPGALTTIQDAGRFGYADMGILQAGAMDTVSMQAANLLLDNAPDEAVLECTFLGPEIRFDVPCAFAIAGADMQPLLDGQKIPMHAMILAKAGSVLKLTAAADGLRTCIAVKGGMDIEPVMGSRSTDMRCGIGGLEGRKMAAGDSIGLRAPETILPDAYKRYLTAREVQRYLGHLRNGSGVKTLRVLWGPQAHLFTEKARGVFAENEYTLSADSDRMGCRFTGTPIPAENGTDIVSDGIVCGAVQITSKGLPIVMTADHQTTGGYAKIAAVITADLPVLAQLKPGEKIRFMPVSVKEAEKAAAGQRRRMKKLARAVN